MKRAIWLLLPVVLVGAVFALQNDRVGFEKGHHGWVTSQHLAIIQRSTPSNWGVGYTREVLGQDGSLDYWYFNRAPFLFEATAHLLLRPFRDDLAGYIRGARQILNGVFVLTLLVAFAVARMWLASTPRALLATLMLGTGHYLLEYKDLVEQNRLGTLASLLVVYAIADFERGGDVKRLLAFSAGAACIGEAAPACFMLSSWCIVSVGHAVWERWPPKQWIRMPALRALLIATGVTGAFLVYNALAESTIRSVSFDETSIVDSAMRRLGASNHGEAWMETEIAWGKYGRDQAARTWLGLVPHVAGIEPNLPRELQARGRWYLLLAMIPVALFALRHRRVGIPDSMFVAVLGGLLYLVVMRRLIAFHDFTITYAIGFHLLFWSSVAVLLSERHARVLAGVAAVFFVFNLVELQEHHNLRAGAPNRVTSEFQAIREALGDTPRQVYIEGKPKYLLRGVPYAPYFYLHGHRVTNRRAQAHFIISKSRKRKVRLQTLTKKNKHYRLLRGPLRHAG